MIRPYVKKILEKIRFIKFKKITSFSLNKTLQNFKEKIKKADLRIKSLEKEKIYKVKKRKVRTKKKKNRRNQKS